MVLANSEGSARRSETGKLTFPLASIAPNSLEDLYGLALALGARSIPGWSAQEEELARRATPPADALVASVRQEILNGLDPLGEAFCSIVSADDRRETGAVYTPSHIVDSMLGWAVSEGHPRRIVDPGTATGRFIIGAGRRFPNAELIAVENNPQSAILARGNLAALSWQSRSRVILDDFRRIELAPISGQTLFIGNPPYVRHHLIGPAWKEWFVAKSKSFGIPASQLAGLHIHFFLVTALLAKRGDIGLFVTSAEWLDVNYGSLARELLLNVLGLKQIHLIEPTVLPFPGTATTAAITAFELGTKSSLVGLRRVADMNDLSPLIPNRHVRRERLEAAARWTPLTRALPERREGYVELGELCRVHRGQVTGANRVWIAGEHSGGLPESVLYQTVTRARELFATNGVLETGESLKRVVDLPADLDELDSSTRDAIEKFLKYAKSERADQTFVARNRKAWWAVGLREPAPILATYMARRPPAFVLNQADARHINIAHGLYPREPMGSATLQRLAAFLSTQVSLGQGRTYAGGLTKFEPREMERLLVPHPDLLRTGAIEDFT